MSGRSIEEIVADLDRQFKDKIIVLQGDHPWAGHTARYLEFRDTHAGPRPVVRITDISHGEPDCFVMDPEDMRVLS